MAKLSLSDVRNEETARLLEENRHLQQLVDERNAELALISSVQQALASKLDIQAIYDLVGDKVRDLFNAQSVVLQMFDPATRTREVKYNFEEGQRFYFSTVLPYNKLAEYLITTKKSLIINQDAESRFTEFELIITPGTKAMKSGVFVPLLVGKEVRGFISLQDVERENAFSESTVNLLSTLASSMGTALENAFLFDETQRLLKETEQGNAELAIINSVQQGLASKLEFQSIIDLVGDQVHVITNAKSISIALYDKTSGMISWPYWLTLGKRIEIPDEPMEKNITRRVMYAEKPLNLGTEQEILAHDAIPPQHGWTVGKSYLGVPFSVGNEMLGALSLHDFDQEYAFHESDERLLQTLANSMSLALENARLFAETEQRAAELQIINSVQEALASKLDIQAIYDLVGDKIREIFHDADAEIRIYDPRTNLIRFPYFTDMGQRVAMDPIPLTTVGITSHLLHTRKTLVINENLVQEMEKYGSKMLPGGHPAKSAVFVPLVVNDQARGLIVLGDVEREHAFSSSDVRLLQTLANSMSTALENARLFDETQSLFQLERQRAAELAIINNVQSALAENLDIQAIYDIVGDTIQDVFDAQAVILISYDEMENVGTVHYYVEKGERFYDEPMALSALHTTLIRTGKTLVFNQNAYEELLKLGAVLTPGSEPPRSGVFVPLMIGNRVFGVISLQNVDHEYAFAEADVRLLETLASSMSVALENARLFDEVQKKNAVITEALERETASNDILRVIAESPTDIQPVLEVIARNAAQLSGSDDAIITLRDGELLRVDAHYGTVPTFPAGEGMRFNRDSVAGRAILEGRPLQAIHSQPGVQSEYPEGDKVASKYGYRMTCAVPLMREGKAIGAISIRRNKPELLTEKQIALIQSFANQAAIAVENVRLFNETARLLQETEQRAAELAIINSVQEGLASKLDMQAVYDLVGDEICQLLNVQSVWIITFDPATRTRRVRYSFENGQRYYTSEVLPYNKLTEHLIATKKPLVINQNFTEAIEKFEMVNIAGTQEQVKSIVYIPIMAGEEVNGFISLPNTERENAFSESDVNLLSTFAFAMSIALENIRLFDETRRLLKETEQRAAELAIINSVQEGLASKLDVRAIYDLVGDKIRDIFHAQGTAIYLFDHPTEMLDTPYCYLKKRFEVESRPFSEHPIAKLMVRTLQPITYSTVEEYRAIGGTVLENSDEYKSGMYVPLTVGREIKGMVGVANLDKEHAYGESDLRLLTTLANSLSTALENARLFDETQRLLKETEQRNAELAIINSVQEGLASKLDMQAIYDLVGDKIRDLFSAQSVWIVMLDQETRTRQFKYSYEKGQRFYPSGVYPFSKLSDHLIATKKTLVFNQNAEAVIAEFEMTAVAGTERFKSAIFVPLITDGEVKAFISLQNIEQENAFSDSDVSLLSTLASSMSVALENARLFDETQRLLKETEQRAAELAIINSVQQGLSLNLEMQAIYESLGDQMQQIFDAQSLLIVTFDHTNEMAHVTYHRERQIRYDAEPYPFSGLHRYIIQSRNTVVINENSQEWQAKYGMVVLPGTEPAKSMIFVPLTSGYRVSGMISLQNLEREHAFSDMDVRLLETLAGYISVAIENANLFDETQRLFLEAKEARTAAEQADQAKSAFLSSMSHELRTPLNAIINFVEMVARGMIGPVNQDQVELLDQSLDSSKHLLNLINDVLDISKIQAGQLTLFIEDQVSIHVEVEAALSIVGGLLQEKGLQLIRDIDPRLPMVSCDRRRLRQVLLNLISNAIKFTNEGTVTVSVKNQGREVLFAVIDTGAGIPLDKQGLIFEPFIQAENGERQVHGTGLGLPISRSLVRAHGGELWLESQPGEGSAFFFTLPVDRRTTP